MGFFVVTSASSRSCSRPRATPPQTADRVGVVLGLRARHWLVRPCPCVLSVVLESSGPRHGFYSRVQKQETEDHASAQANSKAQTSTHMLLVFRFTIELERPFGLLLQRTEVIVATLLRRIQPNGTVARHRYHDTDLTQLILVAHPSICESCNGALRGRVVSRHS